MTRGGQGPAAAWSWSKFLCVFTPNTFSWPGKERKLEVCELCQNKNGLQGVKKGTVFKKQLP